MESSAEVESQSNSGCRNEIHTCAYIFVLLVSDNKNIFPRRRKTLKV